MDGAFKRYITPSIIIVVLASAAYLYWMDGRKQPEGTENLPIGTTVGYRAADLSLISLDGEAIKIGDYRGGFLIIDFMAPWCSPCKEQIKVLREVEGTPGISILSINVDSDYNTTYLQNFKAREEMSWPMASSPESAQQYKVTSIPLIILVDADGVIRYRGYYTSLTQFEQLFESYR